MSRIHHITSADDLYKSVGHARRFAPLGLANDLGPYEVAVIDQDVHVLFVRDSTVASEMIAFAVRK